MVYAVKLFIQLWFNVIKLRKGDAFIAVCQNFQSALGSRFEYELKTKEHRPDRQLALFTGHPCFRQPAHK